MLLSNKGKRYPHIFLGRNPNEKPLMSEGERTAQRVNGELYELEVFNVWRLTRRHFEEVRRHMPYVRDCRDNGKPIVNVPKDVVNTINALCLV